MIWAQEIMGVRSRRAEPGDDHHRLLDFADAAEKEQKYANECYGVGSKIDRGIVNARIG